MRTTDYAFAIWMMEKPFNGMTVKPPEVMFYFRVSRATAFRWLAEFRSQLRSSHMADAMKCLHAA
jgi:hypothetical protein